MNKVRLFHDTECLYKMQLMIQSTKEHVKHLPWTDNIQNKKLPKPSEARPIIASHTKGSYETSTTQYRWLKAKWNIECTYENKK